MRIGRLRIPKHALNSKHGYLPKISKKDGLKKASPPTIVPFFRYPIQKGAEYGQMCNDFTRMSEKSGG